MRLAALTAVIIIGAAALVSCGGGAQDGSVEHPRASELQLDAEQEDLAPEDQKRSRTALHASITVELDTVRGLIELVGVALRYPSLGFGKRSRQALEGASPHYQQARQHHLAARYTECRTELSAALHQLEPALLELGAVETIPGPLAQELQELTAESEHGLDGIIRSIKPIAFPDTLAHFDSARNLFIQAEQETKAGKPDRAVQNMKDALRALAQAIRTQWGTSKDE